MSIIYTTILRPGTITPNNNIIITKQFQIKTSPNNTYQNYFILSTVVFTMTHLRFWRYVTTSYFSLFMISHNDGVLHGGKKIFITKNNGKIIFRIPKKNLTRTIVIWQLHSKNTLILLLSKLCAVNNIRVM